MGLGVGCGWRGEGRGGEWRGKRGEGGGRQSAREGKVLLCWVSLCPAIPKYADTPLNLPVCTCV